MAVHLQLGFTDDKPIYAKKKTCRLHLLDAMHLLAKGKQWFHARRCQIGVDGASGLVHSVVSTAAKLHALNTAAVRLHGHERYSDGDAGHIGSRCAEAVDYEKRDDIQEYKAEIRIAMRSGQRRVDRTEQEVKFLDLIETAKAHFRTKVEHPFRIFQCQLDFRKVFIRGIGKNGLKLKLLFALANLRMVRAQRPNPIQPNTIISFVLRAKPTRNPGKRLIKIMNPDTKDALRKRMATSVYQCIMRKNKIIHGFNRCYQS